MYMYIDITRIARCSLARHTFQNYMTTGKFGLTDNWCPYLSSKDQSLHYMPCSLWHPMRPTPGDCTPVHVYDFWYKLIDMPPGSGSCHAMQVHTVTCTWPLHVSSCIGSVTLLQARRLDFQRRGGGLIRGEKWRGV